MNRLFTVASRTLALGLLTTLVLVAVVTAKGIHPDVLLSFQPVARETQLAAEPDVHSDAVQFAQAESRTQRDSPPRFDPPTRLRSALEYDSPRLSSPPVRSAGSGFTTAEALPSAREVHQLPPLPDEAYDNAAESADAPDTEFQNTESPQANDRSGVEILDPPAELVSSDEGEMALNGSADEPAASSLEMLAPVLPAPESGTPPAMQPTANSSSGTPATTEGIPVPGEYTDRFKSLQDQLQKLTTEQEQQRLAQQAWMESTQLLQQRHLQGKLEGIEASLRDLKQAQADRRAAELPAQGVPARSTEATHSPPPVVREERRGTDGEPRFSIESHAGGLREVLDLLTQKANLNLVLSINIEGDVELSLKNATADEALQAIQSQTGYLVEKSGKKVFVRSSEPLLHQREAFLPPIIKGSGPAAASR